MTFWALRLLASVPSGASRFAGTVTIMIAERRLRTVLCALALVCAGLMGAPRCGSSGPTGSLVGEGPIDVELSQLFITVTNRSGRSLVGIRVQIIPVGRATTFSTTVSRLEPGQKQEVALVDLRGAEGTPFNLRIHRPQTVRVTATDRSNTPYEAELPWN